MPLTDTAIRKALPREKAYRISDERGMYLEVSPSGGKLFRLKYRFGGKEKRLSLGIYPDVSLKAARDKRDEARRLLAAGTDPSDARKAEKLSAAGHDSFEAIAREWHAKYSPAWAPDHTLRILRRPEVDVFPWMGRSPMAAIKAPEVLAVLRRIESRGALQTAHRAAQNISQVFRYAVATGRSDGDPTGALRGALPPVRETHHASITDPKRIGALLRDLRAYKGFFVTQCALRLAPLVFVRPGELRKAEWPEFDLDAAEWRIPAERMKMRAPHIVPLSAQAIEILRELEPLTGRGIPAKPDAPRYVFPGNRDRQRPMSEGAVLAALRRIGYSGQEMTGHGFRSMASTRLHEMGWAPAVVERQLAHANRDKVAAAYNYAEHLPERRKMMQAWADYLDRLANGDEKVVPIRGAYHTTK